MSATIPSFTRASLGVTPAMVPGLAVFRVPRESGLALFGAFASRQKTLHANSGRHLR
jgi:hypothetical protein